MNLNLCVSLAKTSLYHCRILRSKGSKTLLLVLFGNKLLLLRLSDLGLKSLGRRDVLFNQVIVCG